MFSLDSIATGLALLSLLGSVLVTSYLVITEEEAPVFRESISKLSFKDSRDVRVSIIIPARNEEQMIGDCLISLSKQTHQNIEVIVVDDSSTDGTREVVSSLTNKFKNIRLVSAGTKPSGWVGKTWPCWMGYKESSGDFLLFVDADSKLQLNVVELSLNYSLEKNIDVFSISPRIEMSGFWTSAVLPIISAAINLLYPMQKVNDKDNSRAYVFGTFILVRRSVYEKTGGHKAVNKELVEDAAIARLTKRSGFNLRIERGPDQLTTEWEQDPKSIYEGLERVMSSSVKEYGLMSILNAIFVFFLTLYPIFFAVAFVFLRLSNFIWKIGLTASILNIICFLFLVGFELYQISGKISYFPILYPIGVTIFILAIISSSLKVSSGKKIGWKGYGYVQVESSKLHLPNQASNNVCTTNLTR